jgi:hypothetical protein
MLYLIIKHVKFYYIEVFNIIISSKHSEYFDIIHK